jgi:hypothetical protein
MGGPGHKTERLRKLHRIVAAVEKDQQFPVPNVESGATLTEALIIIVSEFSAKRSIARVFSRKGKEDLARWASACIITSWASARADRRWMRRGHQSSDEVTVGDELIRLRNQRKIFFYQIKLRRLCSLVYRMRTERPVNETTNSLCCYLSREGLNRLRLVYQPIASCRTKQEL